jgi:hypothetical protein
MGLHRMEVGVLRIQLFLVGVMEQQIKAAGV